MKNIIQISILLFIFNVNILHSQSVTSQSIAPASFLYTDNFSLDYVIGQIQFIDNKQITSDFIKSKNKNSEFKTYSENINFEISYYPNPVVEKLNIIITSKFEITKIDIKVYNSLGQQIYIENNIYSQKNYSKIALNFSNLEKSIYIIDIQINNNILKSLTILKN
jgi:hypothetical protein